jgi:tRNA(Ile2)-agmatinylcytidine synthase
VQTEFHVGIDDTDSRLGGCTTYTAALIFQELVSKGFKPLDYPWLVRLNPNIPWKTRGNAALSLHFRLEEEQLDEVKKTALAIVEETSDITQRSTDPAVVFLKGAVSSLLTEFSTRALHDVLSVREARHVADAVQAETHLLKGSRGLVGGLASIGADFSGDHTFEIIAYRTRENRGRVRKVNKDSIRRMDEAYRGSTFNNIDPETGRVLICPHGPDPVLFGIRGEDPRSLVKAYKLVDAEERVERVVIFKSNQGTDAHLSRHGKIQSLRPYQSAVIAGRVLQSPRVLRGGHVIFRTGDETGSVDCAAYSTTKSINETTRHLIPGDAVIASGGIRPRPPGDLTMNVEKLEVTGLAEAVQWENPRCSNCGARCESMGKGQGVRCRKCNRRFEMASKIPKSMARSISLGIYLPPPRANRHLTKPASRYGIHPPEFLESGDSVVDATLESMLSVPFV